MSEKNTENNKPSANDVYRIFRAEDESREIPLLFDSPHSGRNYPSDFNTKIPMDTLITGEDRFVDELFSDAPYYGACLVQAEFPRCYIDPNRSPNDIEDAIFEGTWPEHAPERVPSDKAEYGIGLIRRLFRHDQNMYDKPLSPDDILHRIEHYHRPYHQAVATELERLKDKFGWVLHINAHSMPAVTSPFLPSLSIKNFPPFQRRADIVLGDRDGTSISPHWNEVLSSLCEDCGFTFKHNDPFKGVEIVRRYGKPEQNQHSIQMEVNRGLYLDKDERDKNAQFGLLKTRIDFFIRTLARSVRTHCAQANAAQ